ncbi:MAG: DinB family protein [Acidobacteriota bacterium]
MAPNVEVPRHLLSQLGRQAADIERLVADLDEQSLARRIDPGKWSLKELVCHLWRVQQIFAGRIEAVLSEDYPAILPYEPDGDAEFERMAARPLAESLRGLAAERQRLLARLESLDPAGWRRAGNHPEFPDYDVRFQVEYMAYHEAHHIYQMLQRRAALARPGD